MFVRMVRVLKAAGRGWVADRAPRLGAALAYYSIFSLAPLLLISVGLAGLVFGGKAARGEILHEISDTIGPTAAQAVEGILANSTGEAGAWATAIGLVLLVFGASGVFVE